MQFFAGDLVRGIWLGLIGMFLNHAARATYQQVLLKKALQGEPVSCFMNRESLSTNPQIVQQLVPRRVVRKEQVKPFLEEDGDNVRRDDRCQQADHDLR